jgi:hypothetical protein
MFTPEERACLRSSLLDLAHNDQPITGAAITGSAAASHEDQWSDIDLAFGINTAANLPIVLSDWTAQMYDRHGALHHLDVMSGAWTYRVFLLPNTLQVDLAFVVDAEFRALSPTFRLTFGKSNEPRHAAPPPPAAIIGLAWLYALHARTCIARRKLWQAEYMISGVRDNALALACIRHGLKRKAERGFEAQRIETEKHELKKQSHYRDVLKKDALTCQQLSNLAMQNIEARKQNPGFDAEYQAELAKRGIEKNGWEAASVA